MKRLCSSLHLPVACLLLGTASASAQQTVVRFPPATPDPLRTLRLAHPRLVATTAQFNAIVNANDPLRVEVNQRIIASADAMLDNPLVPYAINGSEMNLLASARAAFQDIVLASMAYRLTHATRFSDRARAEMLNVAAYPDWNPVHFLDTAELAMGVSLGYDWTYDALSPQDRATIEQALMTKVLVFAPIIYETHATTPGQLPTNLQWALGEYNWNQVCNGGMLAAALAIAEDQPATARQVIQGVRAYLPLALQGYAPDGAWFEGPVYMTYATAYTALTFSNLQSALGTDFGLSNVTPALSQSALFHLQMQGPSELLFNFGDAHAEDDITFGVNPAFGWLAHRFGPPDVAVQFRANLAQEFARVQPSQETAQYFALNALWLPALPPNAAAATLDAHYRGAADVALFRSSWGNPNALFVGFKAGANGFNHSHLDLGSFVLDSDGVRWSYQLGPDSYGLPQYNLITPNSQRWSYFRTTTMSKAAIAPAGQVQSPLAVDPIYSFHSTPQQAWAIANLTTAYPGMAKKILRGVYFRERSAVLVQDDIIALAPRTPLTWQMLTAASINLSIDGHTATLTQKGKTLQVRLLSPANAQFSVNSANPPTSIETPNPQYSLLVANVPPATSASDTRVAVLLTPIGPNWPANQPVPQIEPLPVPLQ